MKESSKLNDQSSKQEKTGKPISELECEISW
jgi:hypothetical protein